VILQLAERIPEKIFKEELSLQSKIEFQVGELSKFAADMMSKELDSFICNSLTPKKEISQRKAEV